jgi:hypothetical protein
MTVTTSGMNLAAMTAALKEYYTDDMIMNMTYRDNPLYALIPKQEDFEGKYEPVVTVWGNPQSRSKTFSQALQMSGSAAASLSAFWLTRVQDHAIATIDNETLLASKSNAGAFMEAATVQIDGAIGQLTRSVAIAQYRSGWGEIGQILPTMTIAGATVIYLSNPEEITNFETGMQLEFASALNVASRAYNNAGDTTVPTILSVDRSLGTFTLAHAIDDGSYGVAGIAAGDYIFVRGDHVVSGVTLPKMAGLAAWIPPVAPTNALFFNVDRSVDTRLGGLRKDISMLPMEQGLIQGAVYAGREGSKIDYIFMNYNNYGILEQSLGTRVQYIDLKVTAEIAFRGIVLNGTRGPIRVVPDQNCPAKTAFGIQLDTWKMRSLGKPISPFETDGLSMLRQGAADGVEVRYHFYGNQSCKAPGWNINLTLAQ